MPHTKSVSKGKAPAAAAAPVWMWPKPKKAAACDRRLKRNVAELRGALSTLLRLRGVSFEYNELGQSRGCPAGERIGLIAQEVEKVVPEWVQTAGDGYRELSLDGFEGLTVEALRELKAENDRLREEVNELKELVREALVDASSLRV